MLVIRRLVDRRRAYTALMLPGEPPRIFPTSDAEHARILQIYKQDKAYPGIINDFSEDSVHAALAAPSPAAEPVTPSSQRTGASSRRATGSSQRR